MACKITFGITSSFVAADNFPISRTRKFGTILSLMLENGRRGEFRDKIKTEGSEDQFSKFGSDQLSELILNEL